MIDDLKSLKYKKIYYPEAVPSQCAVDQKQPRTSYIPTVILATQIALMGLLQAAKYARDQFDPNKLWCIIGNQRTLALQALESGTVKDINGNVLSLPKNTCFEVLIGHTYQEFTDLQLNVLRVAETNSTTVFKIEEIRPVLRQIAEEYSMRQYGVSWSRVIRDPVDSGELYKYLEETFPFYSHSSLEEILAVHNSPNRVVPMFLKEALTPMEQTELGTSFLACLNMKGISPGDKILYAKAMLRAKKNSPHTKVNLRYKLDQALLMRERNLKMSIQKAVDAVMIIPETNIDTTFRLAGADMKCFRMYMQKVSKTSKAETAQLIIHRYLYELYKDQYTA